MKSFVDRWCGRGSHTFVNSAILVPGYDSLLEVLTRNLIADDTLVVSVSKIPQNLRSSMKNRCDIRLTMRHVFSVCLL